MNVTTDNATHAPRGRPRDPDLEDRVFAAAVAEFGHKGWAGFTIDGVARTAGVGKASVYLRWDSKQRLLFDALSDHSTVDLHVDTGDVRTDLHRLASQLLAVFWVGGGLMWMRMMVEARVHTEFAEHLARMSQPTVLAARHIVRRAIDRGELPADTSPAVVLDAIMGATMMHVLATPPELREAVQRQGDSYLDELVDLVLAGVHKTAGP
jgi:AcrR family transcriptional regulator